MKKLKYEFEVEDDFEVWGCQACPLGILVNVDTEEYKCQLNEYWHDCPLEEIKVEDEMAYCTHCKHFRISREGNPTCLYEEICDIEDCEDSRHRENRPYYERISGKKH